MTRIYDIYYPQLDANVKFKILNPNEASQIIELENQDEEIFKMLVLEHTIANLKTDVSAALRKLPKNRAQNALTTLFNACIMLNPVLDIDTWLQIAGTNTSPQKQQNSIKESRPKKLSQITRQKFFGLQDYLEQNIIGQPEAIDQLIKALKRSIVGLNDDNRPIASFMFSGSTGVGKTETAKVLQKYLFPTADLIRIDCGEYQQKHEVSKLLGAPAGYATCEEGTFLKEALDNNPQTVFLIDEIEKAHPDIFDAFLSILDEGNLTDARGNKLNFRNCIIIMTTNLGNREIADEFNQPNVGFNKSPKQMPKREVFVQKTQNAIKKHFRPEFLNRFDKIIVFNQLTKIDYQKIAALELQKTNQKLDKKGCFLLFDENVIEAMVTEGVNDIGGARGLAQLRRDKIEDLLATIILSTRYIKGTSFKLTHSNNEYQITTVKPSRAKKVDAQK